jgi:hypothetical protein
MVNLVVSITIEYSFAWNFFFFSMMSTEDFFVPGIVVYVTVIVGLVFEYNPLPSMFLDFNLCKVGMFRYVVHCPSTFTV